MEFDYKKIQKEIERMKQLEEEYKKKNPSDVDFKQLKEFLHK